MDKNKETDQKGHRRHDGSVNLMEGIHKNLDSGARLAAIMEACSSSLASAWFRLGTNPGRCSHATFFLMTPSEADAAVTYPCGGLSCLQPSALSTVSLFSVR